jgi:hypothetical protein
MTDPSQSQRTTRYGLPKGLRRVLQVSVCAVCAVLLLVALVLPTLDGPNRRLHMNEAGSVARLRNINRFQTEYAATHPTEGFACQLPLLKPSEQVRPGEYDPEQYLVSGTQYGYKYMVANCHSDANGVATHYGVVALPLEPGLRIFCTDESGLLRYDTSASPTNCLASGHVLR